MWESLICKFINQIIPPPSLPQGMLVSYILEEFVPSLFIHERLPFMRFSSVTLSLSYFFFNILQHPCALDLPSSSVMTSMLAAVSLPASYKQILITRATDRQLLIKNNFRKKKIDCKNRRTME